MSNEFDALNKPGIYMLLGFFDADPCFAGHGDIDPVLGFFETIIDAVLRAKELASNIRSVHRNPNPRFIVRDYDTMVDVVRIGEGELCHVVPESERIPDPDLARLLEKRALAACSAVGGPGGAKGGRL